MITIMIMMMNDDNDNDNDNYGDGHDDGGSIIINTIMIMVEL